MSVTETERLKGEGMRANVEPHMSCGASLKHAWGISGTSAQSTGTTRLLIQAHDIVYEACRESFEANQFLLECLMKELR